MRVPDGRADRVGHRRCRGVGVVVAVRSAPYRERMSSRLRCPCGTRIEAADDDELVRLTQEHLAAEHPGREYSRDEILMLAAMS